jgi:ribonuclease-3
MKKNKLNMKFFEPLQEDLNYFFKDEDLLITALTHSSYANENKLGVEGYNERLEFLGDTVLSLIVSQYLYKKYPHYPEGELTKIRAKVVCESSLAKAARRINLGKYLLLGKGEESTGGRSRESILADASEAITGAIYMDSDFDTVNVLMLERFEFEIVQAVGKGNLFMDYKTELQEIVQKTNKSRLEYVVYKEEGPDHNKVFFMNVLVNETIIGTGSGKNKKEAEQASAKDALQNMGLGHE